MSTCATTTRVESAWSQCLKLKCDAPLPDIAFNFNLRHCHPATTPSEQSNPIEVASLVRDILTDEAERSRRRDIGGAAGQELLNTMELDPAAYPAYYLQNFHYQTVRRFSSTPGRPPH